MMIGHYDKGSGDLGGPLDSMMANKKVVLSEEERKDIHDLKIVHYLNLAASLMKLENFQKAEMQCSKVLLFLLAFITVLFEFEFSFTGTGTIRRQRKGALSSWPVSR